MAGEPTLKVWTVPDAAYQLGTSTPNLYRWIKEGRLSLLRVGGRSFITDAELDRFVAEAQVLSRATRGCAKALRSRPTRSGRRSTWAAG